MIDPFTTLAAVTLHVPLIRAGEAALGGFIGNRTDALITGAREKLLSRIRAAAKVGQLPKNHDMERATLRAAILATHVTLQNFIDEHGKDLLVDRLPTNDETSNHSLLRRIKNPFLRNTTALNALQHNLASLACDLAPDDGKRRNQRRFERAMAKAMLDSAGSPMDAIATTRLATMNPTTLEETDTDKTTITVDQARLEFFNSLADQIMEQILLFGYWAPENRNQQVADTLRPYFFGPEEHWANNYALCYAEELRTDERLFKLSVLLRAERTEDALDTLAAGSEAISREISIFSQAMENSHQSQLAVIVEIKSQNEQLLNSLDKEFSELREELALGREQKKIFSKLRITPKNQTYAAYRPFYFGAEEDEFIGREDAMDKLHKELLSRKERVVDFKWAAVCGEAGAGKSRLALQVTHKFAGDWPVSGFLERSFLCQIETNFKDFSFLKGPTLFVIDYAGVMPEYCAKFIARCAAFIDYAEFPVRLLVLLRRTNDRFFSEIERGEDGDTIRESQVEFQNPHLPGDRSMALVLDGMDKADTAMLMQRRIRKHHDIENPGTAFEAPKDSDLLRAVEDFDKKRRPLFVLMVADAIARAEVKVDSRSTNLEEAKLELFWTYLKRQYDKHWKIIEGNTALTAEQKDAIDRHVTLALLSTMCRGLTNDGWNRLLADTKLQKATKSMLPARPEDFDTSIPRLDTQDLLASIVGSQASEKEDTSYPILEPDLIAESLLMLVHNELERGDIAMVPGTAQQRSEYIASMAWRAEPADAAFFALLCAEDFPEHTVKHNFFVPKQRDPDHASVRAKLFSSLAGALLEPLHSAAATEIDVGRIASLIKAFPFEQDVSTEAQIEWVETLSELTAQLCFIVNRSTPPNFKGLSGGLEDIGDKSGKRQFERAASNDKLKTELPAQYEQSEINSGKPEPELTWVIPPASAKPVADQAIVLLRRLFMNHVERIFSDIDPRVRSALSTIVGKILGSAYWQYRNLTENNGYASTPLASEEIAERNELIDLCEGILNDTELDEMNVALAASMQSAIIYAEWGANPARGETAFQAIKRICDSPGFSNPDAISKALGFFHNLIFNQHKIRLGDDGPDNSQTMDDVLGVANLLFEAAIKVETLQEKLRDEILENWLESIYRIISFDRACERTVIIYIDEVKRLQPRFAERHGASPFSLAATNYIAALLWGVDRFNGDFELVIDEYIRLTNEISFESRSFLKSSNNDFTYLVSRLIEVKGRQQGAVLRSLEQAIKDVGPRARDAIINGLLEELPEAHADSSWMNSIVNILKNQDKVRLSLEDYRKLESTLNAQLLLDGSEAEIATAAEALWFASGKEDALNALLKAQLLLEFTDTDNIVFVDWRDRILAKCRSILETPDFDSTSQNGDDEFVHQLFNTAVRIAEIEIFEGRSPDDWIEILEINA